MLYWGIFTVGFYLGIIFNLFLWSKKDDEENETKKEFPQETFNNATPITAVKN